MEEKAEIHSDGSSDELELGLGAADEAASAGGVEGEDDDVESAAGSDDVQDGHGEDRDGRGKVHHSGVEDDSLHLFLLEGCIWHGMGGTRDRD